MKLYTEEQVKHAIQMARASQNLFTTPFIYDKHEILEQLTPIELPSDEELSEEPVDLFLGDPKSINNILKYKAFQRGAKWMRDKIQGGNK
jgi:hypothetical protein